MNKMGLILAFSVSLGGLIATSATAIYAIFTGRLYLEPYYPPILLRRQPTKFILRLVWIVALTSLLALGCVETGRGLLK
jgi:hypothetical protein